MVDGGLRRRIRPAGSRGNAPIAKAAEGRQCARRLCAFARGWHGHSRPERTAATIGLVREPYPGALMNESPFQPRLDTAGIAAVNPRQHAPQPIAVLRHQDQVDMVRHRHPRPHFHTRGAGVPAGQFPTECMTIVARKGDRPAVAALGDVMRVAGKDGAGEASHGAKLVPCCGTANRVHCHRNSVEKAAFNI